MTPVAPSWPTSIVTGMLGSGKTTYIGRMLRHPDMADTLVLVNEFGEVGLDHHLLRAVTDAVVLLPNGCLCCSVREDVVRTLHGLHRGWLAGTIPDFSRIVIETSGLAEPAPLVSSLRTHPILTDLVDLRTITTLVDAEHGLRQIDRSLTARNQICLADRLVLSKVDLVMPGATAPLVDRLRTINPLASIGENDPLPHPDGLFERTAMVPRRTAISCDDGGSHLDRIATRILRSDRPLVWRKFQGWLGAVLESSGESLLRLKGCLRFDDRPLPIVVQAVHHTFYPIVEAPPETADECALVLIFDGHAPEGLEAGFRRCTATIMAGPAANERPASSVSSH